MAHTRIYVCSLVGQSQPRISNISAGDRQGHDHTGAGQGHDNTGAGHDHDQTGAYQGENHKVQVGTQEETMYKYEYNDKPCQSALLVVSMLPASLLPSRLIGRLQGVHFQLLASGRQGPPSQRPLAALQSVPGLSHTGRSCERWWGGSPWPPWWACSGCASQAAGARGTEQQHRGQIAQLVV